MSKHQPILEQGDLILRPLVVADAPQMFESLNDQEVMRLTGTHGSFTFEAVASFCARVATEEDRFDYILCEKGREDIALGEVVLNEIDLNNQCASFRGAIYTQDNFGRGYGSAAIELLMAFAFEKLALNRVELEVFEFNPRAIHVYEKLGFKHEGRKRQTLLWGGEYFDALVMSLLASEWHERHLGS